MNSGQPQSFEFKNLHQSPARMTRNQLRNSISNQNESDQTSINLLNSTKKGLFSRQFVFQLKLKVIYGIQVDQQNNVAANGQLKETFGLMNNELNSKLKQSQCEGQIVDNQKEQKQNKNSTVNPFLNLQKGTQRINNPFLFNRNDNTSFTQNEQSQGYKHGSVQKNQGIELSPNYGSNSILNQTQASSNQFNGSNLTNTTANIISLTLDSPNSTTRKGSKRQMLQSKRQQQSTRNTFESLNHGYNESTSNLDQNYIQILKNALNEVANQNEWRALNGLLTKELFDNNQEFDEDAGSQIGHNDDDEAESQADKSFVISENSYIEADDLQKLDQQYNSQIQTRNQ
ncbi:UNKNOWN [Stylonychia lemnae]|uniref:Uncharacterized protein n=1 Tax=Stylonychia lemnae TaxID=5949 RepID=A0A078ABL4_STYLE|nr:UNKNOWN [Stylonychia lemnae]|eukprot:CDW78972.1 UNKNOWN [Stylonychia lemnae]